MNSLKRSSDAREIAHGIGEVLAPVLEPRASSLELHAAREVAQMLALEGLDQLLAALEPHADLPWPRELEAVLDRLRRNVRRCVEQGDVEVLRGSDAEFAALAGEVRALEWSPAGASGARAVHSVRIADALAELPIDARDPDAVSVARLTAPVAAALRAAIEWLSGPGGPRRALDLDLDDDVLEVACRVSDPAGIRAAHAVLATVGGQIGPRPGEPARSGRWMVRVPVVTARTRYLMIDQGGAQLALPWSAVLRVLMAPADEIERAARAHDAPLLLPLVPLSGSAAERPLVLLASGLLRGLFAVDRLIWRLTAEPHATREPGPAGLERAVRTQEGDVYWVVEPARLLAPLPLPPLIDVATKRERIEEPPAEVPTQVAPARHVLSATEVTPLPRPVTHAAPEAKPEPLAPEPPAPAALEPAPAATEPPPAPALGPAPAAAVPAPARARGARPRALIIEDSIMARVFLTRMLDARGFETVGAAGAADGQRELARGGWALVCADVELPDVRGGEWLRTLAGRVTGETPVVALVRDRHDRDLAAAAGISRMLRKPFDESELIGLLAQLPGRAGSDG